MRSALASHLGEGGKKGGGIPGLSPEDIPPHPVSTTHCHLLSKAEGGSKGSPRPPELLVALLHSLPDLEHSSGSDQSCHFPSSPPWYPQLPPLQFPSLRLGRT